MAEKGSNRVTTRVTISDVARLAGVSPTTVSHALNGRGQVDPATRERVIATAQELGYRPNRHAQRLRTGGASMIALMSSMPFAVAGGASRLGFLMEVASVVATSALERGLAMVLVPPLASGQSAIDMLDIDGALIIEPSADDAQLNAILAKGLPVVSIGKPGGGASTFTSTSTPIPYVDLRSGETVDLLLAHLQRQGARQIAMIYGAAQRNSYAEAEISYQRMVEQTGMKHITLRVDEANGEAGGWQAAQQLLKAHPQIDAMLVLVDVFAVGVADYLRQADIHVPQDVLIATRYDGIRARTCEPPLTAMNMHLDEVARLATDLLFNRISGNADVGHDGLGAHPLSPLPELIARQSSQRS